MDDINKTNLKIGFIPIICAAPLIYAQSSGIFKKNGLEVELIRAPGWSGVKELLVYDHIDAAHMLSPMPIANQLGLDGKKADIKLLTIQNVNGQALTLANRHKGINNVRDMKGFTFGVPYRFSMQYYLLCYYLATNGINPLTEVEIKEIAPPTMPYYFSKDLVDGVFAPEPFNQISVYRNLAFIHTLSKDIWPGHPCCCFATTKKFMNKYSAAYKLMLKSVLEAEWLLHNADVPKRKKIAQQISAPEYLNIDNYTPVAQSLAGDFPDGKGENHLIKDRIDFIPYPFEDSAVWVLSQMQRWAQLPGKVHYQEVIESAISSEDTYEFAQALGFVPKKKACTIMGENLGNIESSFNVMQNQPFCSFQTAAAKPNSLELPGEVSNYLAGIETKMALASGGIFEPVVESAGGQVGQLQKLFNEIVTNMSFMKHNLTEQNERLHELLLESKTHQQMLQEQTYNMNERLKELNCLYKVSKLFEQNDISQNDVFQDIVELIPTAWQYPGITCARIKIYSKEYLTDNFTESEWKQSQQITINNKRIGSVDVFYLEEMQEKDEGPFQKEERFILNVIAEQISKTIENRQKEKDLQQSEREWHNTFNAMSDFVSVLDNEHRFLKVNDALANFLGKSKDELIGEYCYRLLHDLDKPWPSCPHAEALALRKPVTAEIDDPNVGFPLLVTASPILDEKGNATRSIHIAKDISAIKNAEKEFRQLQSHLQQAQKMEAIGTLAGGIAHDFNNILTGILGFSKLALNDIPGNSSARDDIEKVVQSGNRAKELVKQILTISRRNDQKLHPMHITPIIKETVKFLRASLPPNIEIKANLDSQLKMIEADATQIHQIIMNLATNAFHAMEHTGGTLTISLNSCNFSSSKRLTNHTIKEGEYIALTISDTGIGVGPDIVGHIFDPYFTTKEKGKGTGLGLAIVRSIVESYGGEIEVNSQVGKGTSFVIYCPVIAQEDTENKSREQESLQGKGEQIIFVDDEEFMAELGKRLFTIKGYQVSIFSDSEKALKSFLDEPDKYDLLITDLAMPKLNGIELARKILAVKPQMPTILCTGYNEEVTEDLALDFGFKAFFKKPYDDEAMSLVIYRLLNAV